LLSKIKKVMWIWPNINKITRICADYVRIFSCLNQEWMNDRTFPEHQIFKHKTSM
jgi:hypothetical protein